MAESLITKKKIAKIFKQLVVENSFEKVTIASIMQASKMRRQTFYDHFQDKYELVDWIFKQEAIEKIEDNLLYEKWQKIVTNLLLYFEENRAFYQNIFLFSGQNSFQQYYTQHMKELIHQVFVKKKEPALKIPEQLFLEEFYANAFVLVTSNWIITGCKSDAHWFAKQIEQIFLTAFDEKR